MTEAQDAALLERFPLYDAGRCAAIFSADQDEGLFTVRDQGQFPGVRMANGALWFYAKDQRPRRLNAGGADTGPMKTQAPTGEWRLLCDDRSAEELTVVEGEGHAMALLSIGMIGVVACGGVNKFEARTGGATEELARLFRGKRVRLLFDFDRAGQKAAVIVARRLLEVGATRVAVLPVQEDWEQGVDVEDWLATFDTPDAAYMALFNLIAGLPWQDEAGQAREVAEDEALPERLVRSAARPGGNVVVTTWDPNEHELGLAVIGPPSEEAVAPAFESVMHDTEGEAIGWAEGWAVAERWLFEGERFVPDMRDGMEDNAERGTIIPAAVPSEVGYGSSRQLWLDVSEFVRRWVVLGSPQDYEIVVAYVFMSYRIFDAGFPYVPYLRFHGPPGTGKGRALDIVAHLCCWTLEGQPTADNLHRVVEFYGEVTLCIDEFHLDRGQRRETQERLIDTLNLGNDRRKTKLRCDSGGAAGDMRVNAYSLFGPKIFAGYGYDEHEALARRTANIDMSDVGEVPEEISLFALPASFYSDAYALRQRLMAWRGAKHGLGLPDPSGVRAIRLIREVGSQVGQIFWPLLEMVPRGMPETEKAIINAAHGRRLATQTTREASDDALLLESLFGLGIEREGTDTIFYPASEIGARLDIEPGEAARGLMRLGLVHGRRRREAGRHSNPVAGIMLSGTEQERAIFARHGVTHPDDVTTNKDHKEPGL